MVIQIISLINITQLYPDLFTGITVPTGLEEGLIVDTIMQKYGSLTPIYPEPELFHSMIISFFMRREWNYTKLVETLNFDYNPLENLQREDITTHEENEKTTHNEEENTNSNENGNTENNISGYNTSDYSPDSKQITEYNSGIDKGLNYTHDFNADKKITTTSHGTIGVITSQDMIEKERNVSKFNIYDYIADDFYSEFLIGLW